MLKNRRCRLTCSKTSHRQEIHQAPTPTSSSQTPTSQARHQSHASTSRTSAAPSKMSFDSPLPPYNASDPSATFLNSSCLDLLMIELVPMAYRVVNEVDAANLDERIEST